MSKMTDNNVWMMAIVAGVGAAIGNFVGQEIGSPSLMSALGGGLGAYVGRFIFPASSSSAERDLP